MFLTWQSWTAALQNALSCLARQFLVWVAWCPTSASGSSTNVPAPVLKTTPTPSWVSSPLARCQRHYSPRPTLARLDPQHHGTAIAFAVSRSSATAHDGKVVALHICLSLWKYCYRKKIVYTGLKMVGIGGMKLSSSTVYSWWPQHLAASPQILTFK